MNKINVIQDYQINDISELDDVNRIINNLKLTDDKTIVLDVTGCFFDYPNTSKLMDKLLFHLEGVNGKKELRIIHSYLLTEEVTLNFLFLGSGYFDLMRDKEVPSEEIKERINSKLDSHNISLNILTVNQKLQKIRSIQYGA